MNIDWKKILVFLGLAFGLSWSIAIGFYLLGGKWTGLPALAVGVLYMFMPLAAVVITQRLIMKDSWKSTLRLNFRPNGWFAVALLLPPVLACAACGVALLFPGVVFSPDCSGMFERFSGLLTPQEYAEMQREIASLPVHPFWLSLLSGLSAGLTVNALAGYGEEAGWRGFLYDELRPLGFWRPAYFTGAVWGLWHAPLILQGHNYPAHRVAGAAMMIAWCVLLSPLLSFIRLKTKSVPACAVFHGTLNGTAGLSIMLIDGGDDLTVGLTGLAGFIVLVAVNLAICVYFRLNARSGSETPRAPVSGPARASSGSQCF